MTRLGAMMMVVVLTLTAWSVQAADFASQIVAQGRYYGVGWQNDGGHWSIELFLTSDGGQIAYPSLDCTGVWRMTETSFASVEYTEQILSNTDVCIELGTVTLRPLGDGKLFYSWSENGATDIARAVLVPVDDARMSYMDLLRLTLGTVEMDYLLPEYFR